jgi:Lysophospholipase L1 and related esterases
MTNRSDISTTNSVGARLLIIVFALLISSSVFAQQNKYTTLYYQRASLFEELPIKKSDIVFLGNSITHFCEWGELLNNKHIKNRGISGDIVEGVYDRLDPILVGKPRKIFLMIGINDVSHDVTADSIVRATRKIADRIAQESPKTKLYIQSVLPVNDRFGLFLGATKKGDVVIEINNGLKEMCRELELTYIDIYSALRLPDSEKLNPAYTNDGLHLLGRAYLVWRDVLQEYF